MLRVWYRKDYRFIKQLLKLVAQFSTIEILNDGFLAYLKIQTTHMLGITVDREMKENAHVEGVSK